MSAALPAELQAEDAALYRDLLNRQIRNAADLADLAHAQAISPINPTPEHVAQAAETHDRAVRTMRRTIALATRLSAGALSKPAVDRAAARRELLRKTEDAIEQHARFDKDANAQELYAELYERMDAPDWDDELEGRDLALLAAEICRDLGVAPLVGPGPGRRRTPADIRELDARARARPAPGTAPATTAGAPPAGSPEGQPGENPAGRPCAHPPPRPGPDPAVWPGPPPLRRSA